MHSKISRDRQPFRICCYEIDRNDEDRPFIRIDTGPMLNRQQSSKIKFDDFHKTRQPIFLLLRRLYQHPRDSPGIIKNLTSKRVNPVVTAQKDDQSQLERDDLEYYVPQLVTYMVLECDLSFPQLNNLILEACMTDFYFAHSVYFYLSSLVSNKEGGEVKLVKEFIEDEFIKSMGLYSRSRLSGCELTKCRMIKEDEQIDRDLNPDDYQREVQDFGDINQLNMRRPKVHKVFNKDYHQQGFLSTPQFWADLVAIGQDISKCRPQQKVQILEQLIEKRVTKKLPASVYVPFFKDHTRLFTILNVTKGFLFSTKERSPYSIYLQLFREQEQVEEQKIEEQLQVGKKVESNIRKTIIDKIYQTLSKPFTPSDQKNTLNLKKLFINKMTIVDDVIRKRVRFKSFYDEPEQNQSEMRKRRVSLSYIYDSKSQENHSIADSMEISDGSVVSHHENEQRQLSETTKMVQTKYFPKSFEETAKEFREKSRYGDLKSWKLIHLMVKIGDDLKQQQFAMQLINRFQYIFKKENVDLFLMPYEVVSLGPDFGLIEMINDVTTLDSLFRKLGDERKTLQDLFNSGFKDKDLARRNFMRSLAAYSVVTYFLQVKDRHNGNILLHKDGYIIHIDFGFLLSNAPGRGVELQKKVPFKLLTQYVEILGSIHSQLFFQFRRLFYKGFRAVIKNKDILLTLVKMMYNSHGDTMACFRRGDQTIDQLEERLNPPHDMENYCYELINNSLDHWRARWYDKFQYFLQKIYY